jgi:CcmD family protein
MTILAASDVTLPDNAGYVVAAYLVFLVLLLIYVAIMATRLSRVERELSELNELAAKNEERERERTAA